MSKSKTPIEDFARLISLSFKKCLRLKQSVPNSIIYQIISDPRAEWRRKCLSITLTKEEQIENAEYIKLQTERKARQKLRKKLTWDSIPLSFIPLSQVMKYKICNDKFKFTHLRVPCGNLGSDKHMRSMIDAIGRYAILENSVTRINNLNKYLVMKIWKLYKKIFVRVRISEERNKFLTN